METAFEALPPRQSSNRLRKRVVAGAPPSAAAAPQAKKRRSHSGDEPVLYDTASAHGLQYEYLDHTADVQLHACECCTNAIANTLPDVRVPLPPPADGLTVPEAFVHCALAQWGYMTETPNAVAIDPSCDRVIEAEGRDPITLLYAFLDACLFEFTGDDFLGVQLQVLDFVAPGVPRSTLPGAGEATSPAGQPCFIRVAARGERFVFGKHPQGTEIKAVTFSNMQIIVELAEGQGDVGVYAGELVQVKGGVRLRNYSANDAEEYGGSGGVTEEVTAGAGAGGDSTAVGATAEAPPAAALGLRRGPVDVYVIVDI